MDDKYRVDDGKYLVVFTKGYAWELHNEHPVYFERAEEIAKTYNENDNPDCEARIFDLRKEDISIEDAERLLKVINVSVLPLEDLEKLRKRVDTAIKNKVYTKGHEDALKLK